MRWEDKNKDEVEVLFYFSLEVEWQKVPKSGMIVTVFSSLFFLPVDKSNLAACKVDSTLLVNEKRRGCRPWLDQHLLGLVDKCCLTVHAA